MNLERTSRDRIYADQLLARPKALPTLGQMYSGRTMAQKPRLQQRTLAKIERQPAAGSLERVDDPVSVGLDRSRRPGRLFASVPVSETERMPDPDYGL